MEHIYTALHSLRDSLVNLPRIYKQLIVVSIDFISCLIAVWFSFILRLDAFNIPRSSPQLVVYLLSPLILIVAYGHLGVYRAIFRYTGVSILKTLVKGVLLQLTGYAMILWILSLFGQVKLGSVELPRSILILNPLLTLLLTGGVRALAHRLLSGSNKSKRGLGQQNRLLIYGAGSAGMQALAAIQNSPLFKTLGFIDDNPSLQGREINGHRI